MMGDTQFLIDTSGHCLLCLDKVKTGSKRVENVESGHTDPKIVSFQNICSFLKIDLREVFGDSVGFQGLDESELKGTLCGGCAQLYEVFSKYYVQLEKNEWIQIKLEISLKIIYEKMMATVNDDDRQLSTDFKKEMLRRPYTKFQYGIVERLRRKILQRCALQYQDKSGSSNTISGPYATDKIPVPNQLPPDIMEAHGGKTSERGSDECQTEIKKESGASDATFHNYNSSDEERQETLTGPIQQAFSVPTTVRLEIGAVNVKLEASDTPMSESEDDDDDESDISCEAIDYVENCDEVLVKTETLTENVVIIEGNQSTSTATTSNNTVAIASSSALSKTIGSSSLKEMWILNPETGKHNCKDCSKEFTTFPTFYFHYRTEHLKIKHKCSKCEKGFSQIGSYNRHRIICCKGDSTTVQFKCHFCSKIFPLESGLSEHWQTQTSCKTRRGRDVADKYPPTLLIKRPVKTPARIGKLSTTNPQTGKLKCSLCPREFPHKRTFYHHYNRQHLNVSYHCTLCDDRRFASLDQYRQHHESVHLKVRFKCHKCGECFTIRWSLMRHMRNNIYVGTQKLNESL